MNRIQASRNGMGTHSLMRAVWLGVCAIFLALASPGHAADAGAFQLLVAAPDPVVAGEAVTFQAIAVNIGTEQWLANSYYLEAEIFDARKHFLFKTPRIKGAGTVVPGGTGLFYIPCTIPPQYGGIYYYRVYLVHNEQRVIAGEYASFRVVALPSAPSKLPLVTMGGSAALAYRQTSRYGWRDYTGSLSLNLVGRVRENPLLFNLYTFHTPASTMTASGIDSEIYTILLSYYGRGWNLSVGDVLPAFSPLSLAGTGMRGAAYTRDFGAVSVDAVGARTTEPVEGSASLNGTYERWLAGGKIGVVLPLGITLSGDHVASFDRSASLTDAGPSLTPARNAVTGGMMHVALTGALIVSMEYQASDYWADTNASSAPARDTAYRAEMRLTTDDVTVRSSYQETRPDFYAFGSPDAIRDRRAIDVFAGGTLFQRLSLSAGANRFSDNLDDDPAAVTTTQSIYNAGFAYNSPGPWPKPSVGYALNTAVGDPPSAQDNHTASVSFGLASAVGILHIALNLQQTAFRDNNHITDDLDTNTVGVMVNAPLSRRLSLNLGATESDSKNHSKNILSKSPSYSFSANYAVVPERFTLQAWGTYLERKNDAVAAELLADRREMTCNVESTWLISPATAWTLGGSYADVADRVTTDNSAVERGVNTRLSYSF